MEVRHKCLSEIPRAPACPTGALAAIYGAGILAYEGTTNFMGGVLLSSRNRATLRVSVED